MRLTDEDVDLRRGTLTVGESKTRSGVRTVELAGVAVTCYASRLLARTPNDRGLVFPTPTGCEWDRHTFMGRVFRPAVSRAKLDGMNFHDLRHGHVSLMAAAGVHPTTIAALIGHNDERRAADAPVPAPVPRRGGSRGGRVRPAVRGGQHKDERTSR